jgi:hypothetical protein
MDNLMELLLEKDPKATIHKLCAHPYDFNREFLLSIATKLKLPVTSKTTKIQVCELLQEAIGHATIFTRLQATWRSVLATVLHSLTSDRLINFVADRLKRDADNQVFQYLALVDRPAKHELAIVSRLVSHDDLTRMVRKFVTKYYTILYVLHQIENGRSRTVTRWLAGANPPYWIPSGARTRAAATTLAHVLSKVYTNAVAAEALLAKQATGTLPVSLDPDTIRDLSKALQA